MGAYEKFAQVYDLFMDNIDYEEWADYITGHLREYGIEDGLVLELGCGTGTMTGLLADKGYDMIGVDLSLIHIWWEADAFFDALYIILGRDKWCFC